MDEFKTVDETNDEETTEETSPIVRVLTLIVVTIIVIATFCLLTLLKSTISAEVQSVESNDFVQIIDDHHDDLYVNFSEVVYQKVDNSTYIPVYYGDDRLLHYCSDTNSGNVGTFYIIYNDSTIKVNPDERCPYMEYK